MRIDIQASNPFLPPIDVSGASGALATIILLLLVLSLAIMARATVADIILSAADKFAHFRVWGAENPILNGSNDGPAATQPMYDASVVSVDMPAQITQGDSYDAVITMKNTGTAPWSANGASPVKLGAVGGNGGDAYRFTGAVSFAMDSETIVRKGQTYEFHFKMKAPAPGIYNPAFRMTKDWYGEFGEIASKSVQVLPVVTATPAPTPEPTYPPYLGYVAYGKFVMIGPEGQKTGYLFRWCYDGPLTLHNQRSSYLNEPWWPFSDWDIGGPNGYYRIYSDYYRGSMAFDMDYGGLKDTVIFYEK